MTQRKPATEEAPAVATAESTDKKQHGQERRRGERDVRFKLAAYSAFVDTLAAHVRSAAIAWADQGTEEAPRTLPFIYSQQPEYAGEWKTVTVTVRGEDGKRVDQVQEQWVPTKRSKRNDNWAHIAGDVGFVLNEEDKTARAAKRAAGAVA